MSVEQDMTKTKQLLYYIIANHPKASVTVLMKLCYLIDLISIKELGQSISQFSYKRYFYGPFDSHIYNLLEEMQEAGVITADVQFYPDTDYAVYTTAENTLGTDLISSDEKSLIDNAINELRGYGAKTLTEIAYKTKPMKKLGATLGGDENLNTPLDLNADA